jgi:hypothetical protein
MCSIRMTTSWLAALSSAALLASCGGGEPETVTVVETVTQTETVTETVEPIPDATETTPPDSSSGGSAGATQRKIGGTGIDDGLAYRVTRLTEVPSIPQDEYTEPRTVTPVEGAKLVTADVTVTNNGSTSVDPFCGGTGSVLVDEEDRNFDPLSEVQVSIPGNEICGDALQPGFKQSYTLAFQIPKSATPAGLAVWNSDSDDYSGESYVIFVK